MDGVQHDFLTRSDMKYAITFISFIFLFLSCTDSRKGEYNFELGQDQISVVLDRKSDSLSILELYVNDSLRSTWPLRYPVYQFHIGDVTGDGIPEIAIGPVKTTRFDPKPDKRLFLFRITDDRYIRPLWLGSRVGQPLEDFRLVGNHCLIRTIEREKDNSYLVAEYIWKGFGLEFKQYLERSIPYKEAEKFLNK